MSSYKTIMCNNSRYFKNLIIALEQAKKRNDINRIIQLSADLERFKTLCGYSEGIRQFEASMERTAKELGIESMPEISRALTAQTPNVYAGADKLFIMRDFELIELKDGKTSYAEISEPPERADIPAQTMIKRNIDFQTERFPEICSLDCPHKQCSSYGVQSMQSKPCRNRIPKNVEFKKGGD